MNKPGNDGNSVAVLLAIIAFGFLFANLLIPYRDTLWGIKQNLISWSVGNRYQGWLGLYHYYLNHQNITAAKNIDKKIAPEDSIALKTLYYPEYIAKEINILQFKKNKTITDWIKLAQLQVKINLFSQAKNSLQQASLVDPINDDVQRLSLLLK